MLRADDRALHRTAYRAWDAGNWAEAGEALETLLARRPNHRRAAAWWFDAALAQKFLRNWPRAYELGREAAARVKRGRAEPAFWNLGIAATIVGDWATARDAWQGYGLPVPDGEGEVLVDFGVTPIRLDPQGAAEVVWAERICPTRARVLSVPTPESGRRFGEIVVHDGVPNGERDIEGDSYPVFDELLRWRESPLPTSTARIVAGASEDVRALVGVFAERGYGAEPASGVRMICGCCSAGSLTADPDHVLGGEQRVSLAAPPDEIPGLLETWRSGAPGRRAWLGLAGS